MSLVRFATALDSIHQLSEHLAHGAERHTSLAAELLRVFSGFGAQSARFYEIAGSTDTSRHLVLTAEYPDRGRLGYRIRYADSSLASPAGTGAFVISANEFAEPRPQWLDDLELVQRDLLCIPLRAGTRECYG